MQGLGGVTCVINLSHDAGTAGAIWDGSSGTSRTNQACRSGGAHYTRLADDGGFACRLSVTNKPFYAGGIFGVTDAVNDWPIMASVFLMGRRGLDDIVASTAADQPCRAETGATGVAQHTARSAYFRTRNSPIAHQPRRGQPTIGPSSLRGLERRLFAIQC